MRKISDTRMRCLVKCAAMFGLAHYIYAGEDLPQAPTYTEEQRQELNGLLAAGDGIGVRVFCQKVGQEAMDGLFNSAPKGEKTKYKDAVRKLYGEGNSAIKATVGAIQAALADNSGDAIAEIYAEMTDGERALVDSALTEIEHHQINQLKDAA